MSQQHTVITEPRIFSFERKKRTPEEEENGVFALKQGDVVLFLLILAFSVGVGTLGYWYLNPHWSLIDSFHNSTMILAGMGLTDKVETTGGKFFSSFYALYSGLIFLILIAILVQRIVS